MIAIEPVGDHYDTYAYLCRGHIAANDFVTAFLDQWGGTLHIDTVDPATVQHVYSRLIPCPKHSDFDLMYRWPVKPGRGAFPVTLLEV